MRTENSPPCDSALKIGVEIVALDCGPGIARLGAAMREESSTHPSLIAAALHSGFKAGFDGATVVVAKQ